MRSHANKNKHKMTIDLENNLDRICPVRTLEMRVVTPCFLTSITTIHRPQTSELKSLSKFQLLFHWKNFEKYYDLLYSTLKQVKQNS